MAAKSASILCVLLTLYCCIGVIQSAEVTATDETPTSSCTAAIRSSSDDNFEYELIVARLETIECKLWSVWIDMKEQNGQILRNDSRLGGTVHGLGWVFTKLEEAVGQSLISVMDRSWEVLQEQLSCTNNVFWKKSTLARLPIQKSTHCVRLPTASVLRLYESCSDVPSNKSGKHRLHPEGFDKPFEAYCEQEASGGGWLVVQYRFDGSVDFYRNWTEYRNGFGSLDGEFWLGLETLHRLTKKHKYALMVELKTYAGEYRYALYDAFEIGSEATKYSLDKLGSYSGTATDSLKKHVSMKFTTMDSDNDGNSGNCAVSYKGAWWHNSCFSSNINALYQQTSSGEKHMQWYGTSGGLKYTRMMIRKM